MTIVRPVDALAASRRELQRIGATLADPVVARSLAAVAFLLATTARELEDGVERRVAQVRAYEDLLRRGIELAGGGAAVAPEVLAARAATPALRIGALDDHIDALARALVAIAPDLDERTGNLAAQFRDDIRTHLATTLADETPPTRFSAS